MHMILVIYDIKRPNRNVQAYERYMGYLQALKDIVEHEAEKQNKEQQQDDDEQYDTFPKMKLVTERTRIEYEHA